MGGSSITAAHTMRDAETGEVAATSEKITVYFDLEARKSTNLPEEKRAGIAEFMVGG